MCMNIIFYQHQRNRVLRDNSHTMLIHHTEWHYQELSFFKQFTSAQFSSVIQSCLTLCEPMNHSTPGLPIHHQLLEFTQTHVHWVGNSIQSSHPLSSPSPPPPIPPSIRVFSNESALASVLPKKSQGWSPLEWTGWISLQSRGLSRVFSNTTVQKHQFFGTQLSSQSNFRIHTWPLEKP